jgi:hypothetical protein
MPLTTDQMLAATTAQRLMADDGFQSLLNRITATAAEHAVFSGNETEREVNRQLVLAINRIRTELQADADLPEAMKEADALAKSME